MEKTKCPKCGGTEFRFAPTVVMYRHCKCLSCETILWEAKDYHFPEHGYCGNPKEHWEKANIVT